jgi:HSP20 family protein
MVFRAVYPRHPVNQLRQEMDRLLTGFLGHAPGGWLSAGREHPAVTMWDVQDALKVELEVPGVKSDQVDVSVVGGELSVTVERSDVRQDGVTYHRRERPVGTFTRTLRLPADVDAGKVQAELNDGVLTITLPKAESAKPRKIQVKAAS